MIIQCVVKLGRHAPQFGQIVPRDRRQIVVLIMVAHVQRNPVNGTVVAVSLLVWIVGIMLLNPPRPDRMKTDGKERGKGEIEKAGPAEKVDYANVVKRGAD